ncbi:Ulp1 peptidase [Ranunculus cassubicifolius]
MGGDREVLKYKDIVLRDWDLDTLRGPCFLNDQIIRFYFSYLFSSTQTDDILLVEPSESLCLANYQDDESVKEFAQSHKLSSKRLVLFAINDKDINDDNDCGSHWSVLVYDRVNNSFLHYDSMEGVNRSMEGVMEGVNRSMEGVNRVHAVKLYDAIKKYMGPGGEASRPQTLSSTQKKKRNKKKFVPKPLGDTKPESVNVAAPVGLPMFVDCKTPQQSNGYDCGLYVLAIAKAVCRWWSLENNNKSSDMLSAIETNVDDSVEVNMRSEVLEIIHDLTKD